MVDWKRLRWEAKYYLWYRKLILVPIILVVLALAWPHIHRAIFPPQPKPPVAYIYPGVRGEGSILVNGTRNPEYYGYEVPWVAVLEAKPAKKWGFAYWVINGSKVTGNPLTLVIKGNTTVTAVFAKSICTLSLAGREGITVYLNDTAYVVPSEVEVPCNSTLRVEVEALGARVEEVRVEGDVKYEAKAYVLVVEGNSSYPVYINDTRYEGYEGWATGSGLFLNASCVYYNETHGYCAAGWRINDEEVWGSSQWVALEGDTYAEPIWVPVKKEYPPIEGEVALANGTTKKVTVLSDAPYRIPLFPFSGEYEYLGNATYRVVAKPFAGIFISLPKGWKEVRVEVLSYEWYEKFHDFTVYVILRNDEVFYAEGYGLMDGKMTVIFKNDPRIWGPGNLEMKCKVIEGNGCSWGAVGPGEGALKGLEPGWLAISMSNSEVVFRVMVVLGSQGRGSSCCG